MNIVRPSVLFAALASVSFLTAQEPTKGAGKVETQAPAAEAEWIQNFDEAKAKASKEGKNLLVDFTGSDWCIWCKRLDQEVFAEADFQKEIVKSFVLVKLDFPQDATLVTEEIKAQNSKLQEQYKVQGFPTIFLMDAAGKPFAQTGYQAGGGAKYLEHVAEISKGKAGYDEHMGKAKAAKGIDRAKHIASALEALANDDMVLAHYRAEVDEVMSLDADGKAGIKAKFEAKVAKTDLDAKFNELAQQGEWDAIGPALDEMIEKNWKGNAEVQKVADGFRFEAMWNKHAQGGDWDAADAAMVEALAKWKGNTEIEQKATFYRGVALIQGKQDFTGALKFVEQAIAMAPDSETGKQLAGVKKRIEQMQKQMEKQKQQGGGEEGGKDGGN